MSEIEESTCERFERNLEPYLDHDLDRRAGAELEAHLAGCPACAAGLETARGIAASLRGLPRLEAPPPTVAAVLATARSESGRRSALERRPSWLASLVSRPALVALGAAALVALALFTVLDSPAPAPVPDRAAVARATLETKLALAHLGRANRRVGRGLSEDLVRERLVRPAVRGLRTAEPAPPGGDLPVSERG